jgi:cytochrome P450
MVTERRHPPGPSGNPVLGNALAFQRDAIGMFLDGWREYGDIVRFRGPKTLYLLAHPDHVQYMLEDQHLHYPHPTSFDATFRSATGHGIVDSEGESWTRQRSMLEPTFAADHTASMTERVGDSITSVLERWDDRAQAGQPIDVRAEMLALSHAMLGRCLFGDDWEDNAEALSQGVTAFIARLDLGLTVPLNLPDALPVPPVRRFVEARRHFDDAAFRIIARRQAAGDPGNDVLGLFLRAQDDSGNRMSDRAIRDQLAQHFAAGHGTVSGALYYTCYLMAEHPDVLAQVKAESDSILAGDLPGLDDLPRLRWTTQVILESMRLFPPLWMQARSPMMDDKIGGFFFPRGAFIIVSSYVTHRHPDFWQQPEVFDPDRFSPEQSRDRHPYAYFPLSRGPRDCYGGGLAIMEMQMVLAAWARRFRLHRCSDEPIAFRLGTGLNARHPIPMTVERL